MDVAEDILIALAVSFVCALILGQWLRAASERVRRPEPLSASYMRRNWLRRSLRTSRAKSRSRRFEARPSWRWWVATRKPGRSLRPKPRKNG